MWIIKLIYIILSMWVGYSTLNFNRNTMKLANWKTTLFGALGGLMIGLQPLLDAYKSGAFDGKTGGQLAAAVAIVLLGIYSKDKNVTGGNTPQ